MALLNRGNGGLAEVEEVVNRYEEQSPLYGFVQYRRRKVILKYIPEGTSRLLQGDRSPPPPPAGTVLLGHHTKMKTARVTVQFQSVIERFSPHDAVFSFAESTDLRDSALSSACSLHTATASIKSSNDSLAQNGLAEITEDVSESRADTVQRILAHGSSTSSIGIEDTRIGSETVNGFASADLTRHRSTSATTQSSSRPRATSNTDKPLPLPPPPQPEDHTREDITPGSLLDYGEHNTRLSTDGRFSSSSTRPSTRDLYDAYGYKKKAKMGPRPSTDSVGAPSNLGIRTDEFRPVSTLPAGLRMPSRKAVPPRPASRQTQTSPPIQTSSPIKFSLPSQANSSEKMTSKITPGASVTPICTPDRNMHIPTNRLRTTRLPEPGSPKLTPEKQRLMKALKLRKEQIAAQNSVNGLGIRNTSEEPELAKTEIDDSILSAVFDASNPTEGLEPVPNTTKDLAKEGFRPLEDSPISVPETAEEPSTQASSITDEEEAVVQERQESHLTSIPLLLEHHHLSDNLSKNSQSYLTGRHDAAVEDPKGDLLTENESPEHLSHSYAPMQPESGAAGQNVIEHKVEGKESSETEKHDHSAVMNGELPAEAIGGDKQLPPSQALGSQNSRVQSIADEGDPLPDRSIATELDENSEVKQSEPQSGYEKVPSTGEALKNEDFLQSPCLWDSEKAQSSLSSKGQARALQNQTQRCHRQSLEHPVQDNEFTPQEPPNDVVQPLLVRRSSSAKSIAIPSDNINAHEVPLPPIDEDEEISLSPQRDLFRKEANTYHSPHADGELRTTIRGPEIPLRNSEHQVTGHSTTNGVGERQFRSQGAVNPIKRVSTPDQSDEQFLSDDSFMEELKSATVQEAKPVSVSKSPIKPVFSRSESEQKLNGAAKGSRSVSTPVEPSAKDEEMFPSLRPPSPLSTARSVSAQHAPRPDSQQSHVPIPKKIGVSSSISQRIKALEQLSSRPTSPVSLKLAPNTPTFLGLRTTSLRTPSSGSEHKNSVFNKGRPDTAYPSPSPSLESIKSTLPSQSKTAEYTHPIKPATTATAHDTREKSLNLPPDPSEPRCLELQETPLQLEVPKSPPPTEQKTMGPPPLSPLKPPRPRFGRYPSTRSGSSSSNEQKLESQPTTRRDSFASVRSKSSRAGSEVEVPRTLSDSSQSGVNGLDGTQDEKKDSRRSRLLKRMSSISSMSRRSIAHALSPSPKEAPIIERQEPVQEALSTSVDVGDVNVQFPDNLVSSAFNFWLTSANTYFSFGRGGTWSLMRTAF